jgi:hypothetical protein
MDAQFQEITDAPDITVRLVEAQHASEQSWQTNSSVRGQWI